MDKKIKENLIKFGFSDTEAGVYYAALILDNPSVDQIAKRADINRTSCYPILERLKTMGLVVQVKKRGKTIYYSESPEKILEILEEKKQGIKKIIPDLKSLFEIKQGKPNVKLYEGQEGLKTVLNSVLKEAREVLIFGDGDSFRKAIPGWAEHYSDRRAKLKIKSRIIKKASPTGIMSVKKLQTNNPEKAKLQKMRVLPEAYKIDYSAFDVYNNKVIVYSFEKQNIAVVIESKIIAQMMRSIFEILWNEAKKYNNTLLS